MIQFTGLEGSQGMMDQLQAKLFAQFSDVSARGVVSLLKCDLKDLPLDLGDGQFDVVMTSQVLHHLADASTSQTDRFKHVEDLMVEVGRVTNPDGGG